MSLLLSLRWSVVLSAEFGTEAQITASSLPAAEQIPQTAHFNFYMTVNFSLKGLLNH
jgi:hypothetical protein